MIETIGWIASFLFAFCAAPQAWLCYKKGNADGTSAMLLWMWGLGEILMQVYVILKHGWDMPLLVNYWVNTFFVAIIFKYKYWPRFTTGTESNKIESGD
jgi:uncharacterized protein with PQ loop repeat